MDRALVKYSKLLSLVLRHDPAAMGLELDGAGWVAVDDLLAAVQQRRPAFTRDVLERVVEENDKRRFAFSADGQRIRASQGHSVPVDLVLTPLVPPAQLFHGTASRFLESIRRQGLLAGSRHHVHLSADEGTARTVGGRHGRPVVLVVAAGRMQAEGHEFFQSANGVWLVASVPPSYFDVLA